MDGPAIPATTVVTAASVVTVDSQRRLLEPGAVAIHGDRIAAVGTPDEIQAQFPTAELVRVDTCALLPGLVDTHGHAGHGLTKGIADGWGDEWLDLVEELYFRSTDEAFWRAEGYLSALERLRFGVTTSLSMTGSAPRVDDARYAVAASEGYVALGLRHVVALGPPGPPWPRRYRDLAADREIEVDLDHAIRTTEDVVRQLHGQADGRLRVAIGPSSLVAEMRDGTATPLAVRQLRHVHELAARYDTPVHTHAYAGHVLAAAAAFPKILTPRLSLAHCAGIDIEEVGIMAETGVSASHGPLTHAFALVRFPVIEALEAGVNIAISTDGSAPDRSFDLLAQGRVAVQLQRAYFHDTSLLPAGKVLEMMTIDAALALGMVSEIGSLEAGKLADMIAIELRSPHMTPRLMTPQRLVHVASGLDVRLVMVGGRVLLRDGEPANVDVERVIDDANRAAREAIRRAGAERALEQPAGMWGDWRYRVS